MKNRSYEHLYLMQEALNQRELEFLSPLAAKSDGAVRRRYEEIIENGYRQSFSIDADRVIASNSYTRYIDKTQVFSLVKNDHITHRVLHVQLVSKIARTIGRFLGLNEDLIEAIALGHDLGHPPFGHDGEKFLSRLCNDCGAGYFHHNIQSVHFLENIERKGLGWNLSIQTLDGIFCHNGEIHNMRVRPAGRKTFPELEQEMNKARINKGVDFLPMTMEGCVVRMADTISYVGRDFEDALRLGLIKKEHLPLHCLELLGDSNGKIVFNLVTDLIENSFHKPYLSFSPNISDALKEFKEFNYENIYLNPRIKAHLKNVEKLFAIIFNRYVTDIETNNLSSPVFTTFLKKMSDDYRQGHSQYEIARDFISGMTDNYFLEQLPVEMRPSPLII